MEREEQVGSAVAVAVLRSEESDERGWEIGGVGVEQSWG